MWERSSRPAHAILGVMLALFGCAPAPEPPPPNVLWIVWDTVRARDLGIYGYGLPTTPRVEQWAKGARVFDDAVSPASTTAPAHASMFTGLLPFQHGVDNQHDRLPDRFETIAEILSARGYATYLFSANPYLRIETRLAQGFETVEHPWSPDFALEASRIARAKAQPYADRGLPPRVVKTLTHRKTAGVLAEPALLRWLDALEPAEPWFAFLNYMDAHDPVVPSRAFRERFMTPEQVEASYTRPITGMAVWSYTAGAIDLDAEQLELLRLTYAAAVAELDDHFGRLLDALDRRGRLANTVVVLTSDHGELLGEHHMLNHQFSLYEELLGVPLLVAGPGVAPGREPLGVGTIDLFATLLALVGAPQPPVAGQARDLLAPEVGRQRLSEYPSAPDLMEFVALAHPEIDTTRFSRGLRALRDGRYKYVEASDATHALYDLQDDPGETRDLAASQPARARTLADALERTIATHGGAAESAARAPVSDDVDEMLEALGYAQPRANP